MRSQSIKRPGAFASLTHLLLLSLGSWTSYGLGSENRNLPDCLVLISKMQRPSDQPLYDHYWGSDSCRRVIKV